MKPLAFIGMSGAGKTHWSSALVNHGFIRHGCDDLIACELGPLLARPDGSIMRMGEWMGLPFEAQYAECENRYLNIETAVMNRILESVDVGAQVVIDTTGSVIYIDTLLLKRLAEVARIVYFETPPDICEHLCRAYMAKPLAVLWHGQYQPENSETPIDALVRCYPKLIESRRRAYEELADVRIGYWECRASSFLVQRLLERIEQGSR